MASVASIALTLTARTDKFKRQMTNASKVVQRFGRGVADVSKKLAKFSTAALAASTAAVAAITARQFKLIDALGKTSDKLGIATEDLQALQHAAKLSGIEVRTLEMSLQRVVRRVSEAANGTGEAVDALAELGLNAEALNRLNPYDQLLRIADAMGEVKSQSDRVRLSMKLFDSEGVVMVNMLKDGSAGLEEARARMQALGLQISRTDASKIEQVNDTFTELFAIVGGVSQKLAVELAPVLQVTLDTLFDVGDGITSIGDGTRYAVDQMVLGIGVIGDMLQRLSSWIAELRYRFARVANQLVQSFSRVLAISAEVGEFLGTTPEGVASAIRIEAAMSQAVTNASKVAAEAQREALEGDAFSTRFIGRIQNERAKSEAEAVARERERAQEQQAAAVVTFAQDNGRLLNDILEAILLLPNQTIATKVQL